MAYDITGEPIWNYLYSEDSEHVNYQCPVCGADCETIYTDGQGAVIYGCDKCVKCKEVGE